jgi:hypothetical protein
MQKAGSHRVHLTAVKWARVQGLKFKVQSREQRGALEQLQAWSIEL